MSDGPNAEAVALPTPVDVEAARPSLEEEAEETEAAGANGTISNGSAEIAEPQEVATDAPTTATAEDSANDKQSASDNATTQDIPAATLEEVQKEDDTVPVSKAPATDDPEDTTTATPSATGKGKGRRKSGGVPEHKGKKLNKKASKAKLTHIDAKPGDYFYIRLKGYPLWPGIVCDESMLPNTLIKSRPLTAARADGTYRDGYQDGGPKAKDRTFAVMYLHTNEFGWIPNYDLVDLNFDDVADAATGTRKDLAAAHQLAAEKHDLDYFKDILKNFMEARQAEQAAKEAAKAAKLAKKKEAKTPKKSKPVVEDDEDTEMPDAAPEGDSEEVEGPSTTKATKKRKLEDEGVSPQGNDSVKKPKTTIKLNTPKTTNGAATPKSAKDGASTKSAKPKIKKAVIKATATPEIVAPKEPELTAEEKRAKKEKEILFLRHKLQKGMLTRDQDPKEEEMKQMSEFVSKLEGYADLEVSIIRVTKINKVLKAILKLTNIPKEEEFHFKTRSQTLLDKWNKLLASENGTPAAAGSGPSTITNGASSEAKVDDPKTSPTTNGANEPSEEKGTEKTENGTTDKSPKVDRTETKEKPVIDKAPDASVEEPSKEPTVEPTPVESTA